MDAPEAVTPPSKGKWRTLSFYQKIVKEHLAALTLIIAILYTFPLGVWDRFFVSQRETAGREISELRKIAQEGADLQARYAAQFGGINDDALRQQYGMAIGARFATIYDANKELFMRRGSSLTPMELLNSGFGFSSYGNFGAALRMYHLALDKAKSENSMQSWSDANRLIAQIYMTPSKNHRDIKRGRQHFFESYQIAINNKTALSDLQAAFNLGEWGLIELTFGDWACGQTLLEKARIMLTDAEIQGNVQAATARKFLHSQQDVLKERSGQSKVGCPVEFPL